MSWTGKLQYTPTVSYKTNPIQLNIILYIGTYRYYYNSMHLNELVYSSVIVLDSSVIIVSKELKDINFTENKWLWLPI